MATTTAMTDQATTPTLLLRGEGPKIDGKRLNQTLHHSCQWGCTSDGGMNRLALNDDDAKVRRWFIGETEKLGCQVTVDSMGNIFAVLAGEEDAPAIAMGSHLDTQPTGGRYDGILGVQAGLEVLRAVKESAYSTKHPLAVVVWTNEEGARFIPSMLGSAVWAEHQSVEFGHAVKDLNGISIKQELERHGFLGTTPSSYRDIPIKAYFELHIEQGPILDEACAPVAVVSGVQAFKWFEIKLAGRGSHAGTTPMAYRHNPLVAFTKVAQAADEIALRHGGLATIGRLWSDAPQSTNCILDDIVFHLDLRHHEDGVINSMEEEIRTTINSITGRTKGVRLDRFKFLTESKAVKFDPLAVECVRKACEGFPKHELVSGAGHDSVHTAKHVPTAMIFVRCKDGVSHHPSEYSTAEDITIGAEVLLRAVLAYDEQVE